MKPTDLDLLLERHLDGTLEPAGQQALVTALREHDWAQDRFVQRMALGAELRHRLETDPAAPPSPPPPSFQPAKSGTRLALLTAAGVILALGLLAWTFAWFQSPEPQTIATLLSNENAAWESALPTTEGSPLPPGEMRLKSGVATLQFTSGAEITLEAPAHLQLTSPMRCRLLAGTAIINVPESAHGFLLHTPDGYAVDHGTAFAVSVAQNTPSSFEVLEGEIALHVPDGDTLRLKENEAASITSGRITRAHAPPTEGTLSAPRGITRLHTQGRSLSIIGNNDHTLLHPDFLMVKRETESHTAYERQAYFAFTVNDQPWDTAQQAKLVLNLVPCGLGSALHLAETNRFILHGLPAATNINWTAEAAWSDLPPLADASPLGTFDIPRSQHRGTFHVQTKALLDFLKTHPGPEAVFILTRETPERLRSGLIHAFASDSHPEASGPTLEITTP